MALAISLSSALSSCPCVVTAWWIARGMTSSGSPAMTMEQFISLGTVLQSATTRDTVSLPCTRWVASEAQRSRLVQGWPPEVPSRVGIVHSRAMGGGNGCVTGQPCPTGCDANEEVKCIPRREAAYGPQCKRRAGDRRDGRDHIAALIGSPMLRLLLQVPG